VPGVHEDAQVREGEGGGMSTIALRYHPLGDLITFTMAQCEKAIRQAEKEFQCAAPNNEMWFLRHPYSPSDKVISRARELLFLWRKI